MRDKDVKSAMTFITLTMAIFTGVFWRSSKFVCRSLAARMREMTRTEVEIGVLKLSLRHGRGVLHDVFIGNPSGFQTDYAMKVTTLKIDVDMKTVFEDTIHIRRIAIVEPDIIYEKCDAVGNFQAIQKNIAEYLSNAASGKVKTPSRRKLIVDEFVIDNARLQACVPFTNGKIVGVPLSDIVLRNIGVEEGGISPGELGQQLAAVLATRLTAAVLMKTTGEALDKATSLLRGLLK